MKQRSVVPLLLPTIIVYAAIFLIPLGYVLYMSTLKWNIISFVKEPYGLQNYFDILRDNNFWNALWVTFKYTISAVSLELLFGYAIALLLNMKAKGGGVVRSVLMLPQFIAPILIALTWRTVFNPDFGLLNYLLGVIGLKGSLWVSSTHSAFASVMLVEVWQWTPYMAIILFAGLQAIPPQYYEAARIDGANRWQILRKITLPLNGMVTGVAIIFRTLGAFRSYDLIYGLTNGGPGNVTTNASLFAYRLAFEEGYVGKAAATCVILLIVIIVICVFLSRSLGDIWATKKST